MSERIQLNILEYLERTATRFPLEPAYCGGEVTLGWGELFDGAKALGTYIAKAPGIPGGPVLAYMEKSPLCILAFMGILESGNPYVPLDTNMPGARIELIVSNLKPAAVITTQSLSGKAKELFGDMY